MDGQENKGDGADGLPPEDDQAMKRLIQAHRLIQPASDEAHAIDQRATVIATVASLAASLSPAGAALLLDVEKMAEPFWIRPVFGIALGLSVTCFLIAAALCVSTHRQNVPLCDSIFPSAVAPGRPARRGRPRSATALSSVVSIEDGGRPSGGTTKLAAGGMHKLAEEVEGSLQTHWMTVRTKRQHTSKALTFLVIGLGFIVILTWLAFVGAF
jgi:hypothetical protein